MVKKLFLALLLSALLPQIARGADEIAYFLEQARTELRNGAVQDVIQSCDRALKINSNCLPAHWYRALALEQTGDFNQALTEINFLLAFGPTNSALYRERAAVEVGLGGFRSAIEDCSRAIKLDPTDGRAYEIRAQAYYSCGSRSSNSSGDSDRQKAAELHNDSTNPYDNPALPMYAPAQASQADPNAYVDRAAAPEQVRAEISPDITDNLRNQVATSMAAGDFNKALEPLDRLLKLLPENPELKRNRAICLVQLGKLPDAIQELNSAIQISPLAELYALRADIYCALHNFNQALVDAKKAAALNADLPGAHLTMAKVFQLQGHPEKALVELQNTIKLAPKNAEAFHQMGDIFARSKDLARATIEYSQALRLNPADVDAYIARAECYETSRQYQYALGDYTSALRYQPDNYKALGGQIRSAFNLKQYARVIDETSRLIARKFDQNLLILRAFSYEKLGFNDKSLSDINAILAKNPNCQAALAERLKLTIPQPGAQTSQAAANQALADIALLLQSDRGNIELYKARLQIEKSQQEWLKVVEDASTILNLKTNELQALEERADAYMQLGRYSDAIDDLTQLIKTQPTAKSYKTRAQAYYRLGQESLAIRDQELSLDLQKNLQNRK